MKRIITVRKYRRKRSLSKGMIIVLSGLVAISAVIIGVLVQTDQTDRINRFISPEDAFTLIQENQNNPDFVIIDDRSTDAFNSGHIGNAINIQWGPDFANRVRDLDKNRIYLVYCRTGCGATSQKMKGLGFIEVYEIAGGLDAWRAAGLPIES